MFDREWFIILPTEWDHKIHVYEWIIAWPIGILSSIDKNGRSGLVGAIARGQNTFFMNGYWLEPIGVLSSIVFQQVRMMGGGWWVSWW